MKESPSRTSASHRKAEEATHRNIGNRISTRLSRISINRLSFHIATNRKSNNSLQDHLFPQLPYNNVSSQTSHDEGIKEIIENEAEYLPDPIDSIIVDKIIARYQLDLDNKNNDRYYYTHLYETTIKNHLNDSKYLAAATQSDNTTALQVFDNELTRTFSKIYDVDCGDFEKYDRKVKREEVLMKLTQDAYVLKQLTKESGLLDIGNGDDIRNRFYSDLDSNNSLTNTEILKVPKLAEKLFSPQGSISFGDSTMIGSNSAKRISSADTINIDEMSVVDDAIDENGKSIGSDTSSIQTTQIDSQSEYNIDDCVTYNYSKSSVFDSDIEKNRPTQNSGLQRKLSSRTLQMIAFGSALGNGLLLNSGKNFTISGPLGTLVGYTIAGLIVFSSMLSYCEVITVIPISDGISGLASRFVDEAYGFALGWGYWAAFTISLPAELIAAIVMLSYYEILGVPGAATVGWVTFFLFMVVSINLFDVRVFGEVEYGCNLIKIAFMIVISIISVVINTGSHSKSAEHIGMKYWNSAESNTTINATYGLFRPTYDLNDIGTGSLDGIGGGTGRFLAIITSVGIASYAYCGTEIVGIAATEVKNPRKALPAATKKVFWRIIFFYILAIFLAGINIYSGDPRLLRYLNKDSVDPYKSSYVVRESLDLESRGINVCTPSQEVSGPFSEANRSPWTVAAQSVGMCSYASVINGFIVFFTISAASSQLYASSRTLYALSIKNQAPKIFSRCSSFGIPYVAVLFTGSFGFLALFAMSNEALRIFQYFVNLSSTFVILAWGGMCLSFIRYYYALQLRPDIISRDDPRYPFKSPLQPFIAFFGLIGTLSIIVFIGANIFVDPHFNAAIFLSSYGAFIAFLLTYFSYKFIYKTRIKNLDQIDLDIGRKESDKDDWNDSHVCNRGWIDSIRKFF
ncbi:hypothetical protein DASC09_055840 [Saccharomycopsis crataegensis]|uniref:Amino acid permease/ SLC12A domain-containing protein n=1 Tax=Saccharomycopsis crataegensis TaxID=43959 RepID=A0AAV5QTI7_9ASCO|nr:hypothetical protein DASC09_055840 [Saccharomycopsis crataegensis]